ncbi:MAG: hypothetical protein ACOC1F_05430 [Myxococcota bacterium]
MTAMWFHVDGEAVNEASRRMEWAGLLLIAAGVLGMLFGMFWIAFSVIALVVEVGMWATIVVLVIAAGFGPLLGASLVLWLGVSRRLVATRLRDLRTLAHARGGVTTEQVAQMLGSRGGAERLLRKACELGVAAPGLR